MTTSILAAMAIAALNQSAVYDVQIVALPFPTDDALPADFFEGDKFAKAGRLKAKSISDFGVELNKQKPTMFIAHLVAEAWPNVNCYLQSHVATGEGQYTLASVSKIKTDKDELVLETTVSDGQLKSNLTFTGGKFNHRDKFKIGLGEIHYRLPRAKLKNERILLLFIVEKKQNS